MTTLAPNKTQLVDRIEEVGTKIQKVRQTTASVIFGCAVSKLMSV